MAIVLMASSCPTMDSWITSSILSRRSDSSMVRLTTGMPVHMLTTSAISSLVTIGVSFFWVSCHSCSIFLILAWSWTSRSLISAAISYCCEAMALSLSRLRFSRAFCASAMLIGTTPFLILTRDDASSMMSMALSGRKRSEI